MTVRVVGVGAVAYGTTALSVPRANVTLKFNDTEVLIVANKDSSGVVEPTAAGWTVLSSKRSGTGTTATDQGPSRITFFTREASGGDTGAVSVAIAAPSSPVMWGQIIVLRRDRGKLAAYFHSNNSANNTASSWVRTFTFTANSTNLADNSVIVSAASTGAGNANFTGAVLTANTGVTWRDVAQTASVPSTQLNAHLGGFVLYRELHSSNRSVSRQISYGMTPENPANGGPITSYTFYETTNTPRGAWNFNEASESTALSYGAVSAPITVSGSAQRVAGLRDPIYSRALLGGGETTGGAELIASGTKALSLTTRFKYDGGSGDRGVLTLFDSESDCAGIFMESNKIGFWVSTSAGFTAVVSNESMQSGSVYDIAGVWNGNAQRIYINGVLQDESTTNTGSFVRAATKAVITEGLATVPVDTAEVYDTALTTGDVHYAAAVEPGWSSARAHTFPGQSSSSGRYLLDSTGVQPWFVFGDAAWNLLHEMPAEDHDAYLANRDSQGFNCAYIGVVRSDYEGSPLVPAGYTASGLQPFAGDSPELWDITQPLEPFWLEVDNLVAKAGNFGVTLFMQWFTTWSNDSFSVYTRATDAQVRAFGAWLAARYKSSKNIIHLLGGDWTVAPNGVEVTGVQRAEQLILGLRDGGDTHHVALHYSEESQGRSVAQVAQYATVSPTYSYRPTYYRNRLAYAQEPHLPVFLFEANYEHGNGGPVGPETTDETIRRQALWTLTAGGVGHCYGDTNVYLVQESAAAGHWTTHLSTAATAQLRRINSKLTEHDVWPSLVPDTSNSFVTAGRGTEMTVYNENTDVLQNDYASAALTPDKTLAVVYVPTARTISLDLSKLASDPEIRLIDPTGESADVTVPVTDESTVSVPSALFAVHGDGASDWFVVAEATAAVADPNYVVRGGQLVLVNEEFVVKNGTLVPLN